jgi:hypothetical protein
MLCLPRCDGGGRGQSVITTTTAAGVTTTTMEGQLVVRCVLQEAVCVCACVRGLLADLVTESSNDSLHNDHPPP